MQAINMIGMKFSTSTLIVLALMSGCATVPAPTVPGEGRYLIMSAGGSPMAQIDAKDDATCKAMGNSVVKRNPNMAGLTRCEPKHSDSQLPFMAIARDNQLALEITSRYRTEDLCKKSMANIANNGNTVVRNCTKTG